MASEEYLRLPFLQIAPAAGPIIIKFVSQLTTRKHSSTRGISCPSEAYTYKCLHLKGMCTHIPPHISHYTSNYETELLTPCHRRVAAATRTKRLRAALSKFQPFSHE